MDAFRAEQGQGEGDDRCFPSAADDLDGARQIATEHAIGQFAVEAS
jgi:hypothetical protein